MYRTFDDLCRAAAEGMGEMPHGLTHDEMKAWVEGRPDLQEIVRLINVYCDAESNPPEGIIGVGCITYAEQMLQEAQG